MEMTLKSLSSLMSYCPSLHFASSTSYTLVPSVSCSILPPEQPQASKAVLIFWASASDTGVSAKTAVLMDNATKATRVRFICLLLLGSQAMLDRGVKFPDIGPHVGPTKVHRSRQLRANVPAFARVSFRTIQPSRTDSRRIRDWATKSSGPAPALKHRRGGNRRRSRGLAG